MFANFHGMETEECKHRYHGRQQGRSMNKHLLMETI